MNDDHDDETLATILFRLDELNEKLASIEFEMYKMRKESRESIDDIKLEVNRYDLYRIRDEI